MRRPIVRLSLRLRITAVALIVVVAALSGAGVLVIGVVEHEMTNQIDTTLRADADFTTRLLARGSGLPMGEGPTDLYVQFVGADGRVLGAGTAATGRPALARPDTAHPGEVADTTDPVLGDLRVVTEPVPNNPVVTLVLARSSANVADVRASLERVLRLLVGIGSVALGLLIWVVVGRALRPVDRMRRTVDEIEEHDLHQRVRRQGTGDELDRLADTLNGLLERLEAAVDRERQFVADASHELRTPLAGMRALLETEALEPELVVLTRADALAQLDALQALVEQLLVLARADADGDGDDGPLDASAPVDLDELVLATARQLARTTALRIDTSRVSGGQVRGRDADLARVVENLAGNAARFARSTVSFSVQTDGDRVELIVSDDGPGVPTADRDRIFERFSTLEASRSAGLSGTGLGLAIVASIVRAHGGSITVDTADGGGARFVVALPTEPHLVGPVREPV